MTTEEFLQGRQRLLKEYMDGEINAGCFQSTDCKACVDCMFSSDCVRCYKLTYAKGCSDSSYLTQSNHCRNSYSLAFCEECDHCSNCNYVFRLARCAQCDYCFGCVGLVGKDFHILNQPYRRSDYFKLVKELKEGLALLSPSAAVTAS